MLTRSVLTSLPLVAALTAAGCGTTTIDSGKAEGLIRKAVVGQVGAKVKSVSCPHGREAKAGDVFGCDVVGADGTKGGARVRQKDDKGNVSISAPFLHVREAESAIVDGLKQKTGIATTVRCPEIIPVAAGGKFTCKASAQGQTRPVQVSQTDAQGHFNYKLG